MSTARWLACVAIAGALLVPLAAVPQGSPVVLTPRATTNWNFQLPRKLNICTGDQCAVIDWSDGVVSYSGDMPVADSARAFFEAVGKHIGGCR